MNPHNPRDEEKLFAEALALPEPERAAFLEQACGSDTALRTSVEELLCAHHAAGSFLPSAIGTARGTNGSASFVEEQPGDWIGRYKLMQKIGEGGCGIVYMAEQEEPVRRRVALKVIKLGMDTKEVVARFEAERQALAMMDHPNIAKVLDAGATASGRPFFVMDLVRGIPVTKYCDEHSLATEQRLELFSQICHAIQHAHQKGIIHRDIKPTNILVTLHDGVPVPKVIDFGIAKATQGRLTDNTYFTAFEQFIGTPAYMSPEQAEMSGLDIDTRSDVYSLGVLLYELLAGRPPFDPKTFLAAGIDEMRRLIREVDPPKPSTRLSTLAEADRTTVAKLRGTAPAQLSTVLAGDLDWIVMRCLEKDRTRRYETANGLAADLQRHLSDEPVVARPPSRSYKFEKFVRRNRTWVIAGTMIALALIAGLAFAFAGFSRARIQQRAAETARREAEDLVSFMIKDLKPELQLAGRPGLTAQVAERAVLYFSKLPPDLYQVSTERNRAIALEALAYVRSSAGNMHSAVALWHEALAARRRAATGAPGDPLIAVEFALTEFVDVSHGYPLLLSEGLGPGSPEIDASLAAIVDRARHASRNHLDDHEVSRVFAQVLFYRSQILSARANRPAAALAVGREAEALYRNLLARSPRDLTLDTEFVQVLTMISYAAQLAGDFSGSIHTAEESLAFAESELEKRPRNIELLDNAAFTAMQLGYKLSSVSLERSRAAEAIARQRWQALMQTDPTNFRYRHEFAWAHLMEGFFLDWEAGRIVEAQEAVERFIHLLAPVAQSPTDYSELRWAAFRCGALAAQLGDRERAHAQLEQARAWHQKYLASLPPGLADQPTVRARYLFEYCEFLSTLADWPELERQARAQIEAIADAHRLDPNFPTFFLDDANAKHRLAGALLRHGLQESAILILQEARQDLENPEARDAPLQKRSVLSLEVADSLAESLVATGDAQKARALLERNFKGWEKLLAEKPTDWALHRELAGCAFLLATLLDPSEPSDAKRRLAVLERASAILTNHAAETRLNIRESELLTKIKTLRSAVAKP